MPARLRRKLRHQAILVCMGEDGANGRLRWQRGRLRVAYDPARNPVLGRINETLGVIGAQTNSRVRFLRRRPFTVHPLGGARLAPTPEEGVVDADGRVFGHEGLHVADAAALPAAPGRPPSMTISAWAAHVSDRLLATGDSP
jgi:cholesterol oxidase